MAVFFCTFSGNAQERYIRSFANDMLKIADHFASPAADGASYLSGAGWFSSGSTLDLWEIEFSAHANVLFVPGKRKTASVSSGEFSTFDVKDGQRATIPTAFGGKTDVVFEGVFLGQSFEFDAIDGVDKSVLAHPFLQASVGLPYETEFILRFSPQVTVDDVNISTYGVGLKHNINQYFPYSQSTDFQFAALVAYSRYDVDYRFMPVVVDFNLLGQRQLVVEMDEIQVGANLWLLEFISSKTFENSGWEVFAALGATNSSFGYAVDGGGLALGSINSSLDTLDHTEIGVKGDVGFNYKWSDFGVSSMLSIGSFFNYNLGIHYRL